MPEAWVRSVCIGWLCASGAGAVGSFLLMGRCSGFVPAFLVAVVGAKQVWRLRSVEMAMVDGLIVGFVPHPMNDWVRS